LNGKAEWRLIAFLTLTWWRSIVRVKILFALSIIVIAGGALATWHHYYAPYRDFGRLLAGDDGIELKSLTLVGQGQTITLGDPTTMEYLARSFRSASKERLIRDHGHSYCAYIDLGWGTVVMACCDTPDNADGITIAFPYHNVDDPPQYWISFAQPMPPALSAALFKMRHPNLK
jgi:hypothetical protein